MATKQCSKCGETKNLSEFHKDNREKDGHNPRCKTCIKQYNSRRRAIYKKNPRYRPAQKLKERYGITLEDYDQLLEKQEYVCAICGAPETAKGNKRPIRRLSVDHDHETGALRGLLCSKCNTMLGNADDSVIILAGAIRYLLSC